MTWRVSVQEVAAYYDSKTQSILQRYGPGPRVHYHTGLVDDPPPPGASATVLHQELVASQERLLRHAANVWRAQSTLCGEVLDVGCGLGGGAIFWAQEFGARVTAVTNVASHVDWIVRFTAQAGVESRVRPLLCNAPEAPGESCFDAAVALDSCCHMPRKALFRRLASLLRPGGRVFITDFFFGRPEYEEPFNRHWFASIGTIDEYIAVAREAGLREELVEDVSHRAVHFWRTTLALIQAEAQETKLNPTEAAKFEKSLHAHALVRQGFATGGLRYALLSFSKV
jgi:cyclopropane fatty-acyl-phospholipid synthase-like methyltransferase